MKQPSSWTMAYVTPLFVLLVTTAVLMIGASEAWSYPQYSEDGDSTNCRACHGDFRANPYTSPSGDSWTDDLHDVHRNDMLDGDCLTCHTSGPRFPVLLDSSTGGDELAAISCVGCHGRAEDDSVANGGTCTISDCGPGAGLRQHHFLAGVTICADCHDNADPANYTPVGEDVLPPYYFTPDQNHLNKPTDPCNPNDEEGAFGGNLLGLDNDGDDVYDTGDPDCGGSTGCQSDAECDDAAFCNGAETCNLGTGQCMPGTPVNVDDGVGCTDDSCDEINDVVVNALNDGLCDNGAFCDGLETCDAVSDCQASTPVNVDDGVGCTDDSCDETNDVIVNLPNDGLCDNGAFCDGSETCDAVSDCQAGTAPCDSANETCDEGGDVCEPIGCQSDAECDDAAFCNGAETCNLGTGQCMPGTPVTVDDGVGCTDDSCDETNDVIVNLPNDGLCDNGAFCDGSETCDAVSDCQAGTAPCDSANETCDEGGDVCEPIGCQSDAECDDAAFCNGAETCNLGTGQCMPGTPVTVDDGVGCTDDSCDEINDVIVNVPNDGRCDNGAFCDGSETCDAVSDCQAGTAPCDSANETCDEGGDVCEPIGCQSDAECDDAAFCNGAETCNLGTGQCMPGTPVTVDDGVGCTDDSCDEINDLIVNALNDGLCDNGAFCDGLETCDAVSDCQAGTAPCDSANETCDEGGDVCEPIGCQSDAECDDAAFCNGAETCNLGTGQCMPGTPVTVDDGVGCTDDSCDEINDLIVNALNDGLCDNGAFCDGLETCDAVSDCQAGTAVNVDDGVGCTDDSCDEINDLVVNALNDGRCDNGAFCDGLETCDAVSDCQAGTAPCDSANETCDEVGDICETDSFSIGGTVTGLQGEGLVLQNNGGDSLSIERDGQFSFQTPIPDGSSFEVTVFAQPNTVLDEICRVTYGLGTVRGSDVNEVDVRCSSVIFADGFE